MDHFIDKIAKIFELAGCPALIRASTYLNVVISSSTIIAITMHPGAPQLWSTLITGMGKDTAQLTSRSNK